METITFFISVLALFASLYYFFSKIIPIRPRKDVAAGGGYHLPPGSIGWPIIGETLEYLRTGRDGVPEKFMDDRRKKYSNDDNVESCKVFKTSLLGEPMAMLCTAAGNKFLFSNEGKLVKAWWPPMLQKLFNDKSSEAEFSKTTIKNRKAIFPFLKPDAVGRNIRVMDQVTKEHFKQHWDRKQAIKFLNLFRKHNLTLSCRLLFNLEDPQVISQLGEYIREMQDGLVSLPIDFPGTNFNRGIKSYIKLTKAVAGMVEQRKSEIMNLSTIDREELEINPPEDLVSCLLTKTQQPDVEELTAEEISRFLCGALLAGSDPLTNTVCSTLIVLSKHPEVYEAVLKEQMEIVESKDEGEFLNWGNVRNMKYTWNVICEVMRLEPPVSGTFREAMSDFVYEGYLIPKGMKMHWNVHATHKNPQYFPNPHKFDPSRFEGHGPPPYSYLPFGGGPRMCPGKEQARYVMLVFMHNLVTRFKWEMVYPDEKMIVDPLPYPSKGLLLHVFPLK